MERDTTCVDGKVQYGYDVTSKLIYKFDIISIKKSQQCLCNRYGRNDLYGIGKNPRTTRTMLKTKNEVGRLGPIKTYCKATIIQQR